MRWISFGCLCLYACLCFFAGAVVGARYIIDPVKPKPTINAATCAGTCTSFNTPTLGNVCKEEVVSGDITYFRNDKTCATLYQVKRHDDFNGWWYAYIVGTQSQGIFNSHDDAVEWINESYYIRRVSQVR
jgi:hypothetical protein